MIEKKLLNPNYYLKILLNLNKILIYETFDSTDEYLLKLKIKQVINDYNESLYIKKLIKEDKKCKRV